MIWGKNRRIDSAPGSHLVRNGYDKGTMNFKSLSALLISSLLIFNLACSSKKPKEPPPPTTPVSAQPETEDTVIQPHPTAVPVALNPEQNTATQGSHWLMPADGGSAVATVALVGAVLGISKVFQTKEERNELNGKCVYGEPDSPMVSPCINVRVNLMENGQTVSAFSSTNRQGDFRFSIPTGKSYFVQVVDRKGRTTATPMKVGKSSIVSLYLKP